MRMAEGCGKDQQTVENTETLREFGGRDRKVVPALDEILREVAQSKLASCQPGTIHKKLNLG